MDDNRVKQRIIGAIVLVALGIIFIPMILSGGRDNALPLFGSPIPDKPDNLNRIKVVEFDNNPKPPKPRTEVVTPVDEHSSEEDVPVEAPAKPKTTDKIKQALKDTTEKAAIKTNKQVASAWVVQLGSFSQQGNAMTLKEKLIKNGFKAFVEKSITHDMTSYRVRVGPEVNREDAVRLQQEIEQKMNMKGLVLKHP